MNEDSFNFFIDTGLATMIQKPEITKLGLTLSNKHLEIK